MELSYSQYQRIADCFPRQRGNVGLDNLSVLNAILYVAENGCKWRSLPADFGNWHTIYTRMSRWSKAGVLDRVFATLQQHQILAVSDVLSLDSTSVKVHPDGTGALKNTGRNRSANRAADTIPKFIWLPRVTGLR
jgi:transposase